jgi:hypothetical protein
MAPREVSVEHNHVVWIDGGLEHPIIAVVGSVHSDALITKTCRNVVG